MPTSNNNRKNKKKKHKKDSAKKPTKRLTPSLLIFNELLEKFPVEIIKVYSVLKHFVPSNNNWISPLKCRLGQSFRLLPDHPKYGFCLIIDFDIYETNVETDFMLDVPAQAVIRFTPKNKWSRPEELYGCYLNAIIFVNNDLVKDAIKLKMNVDVTIKPAPFEQLKDSLNKAIENSFDVTYEEDDL